MAILDIALELGRIRDILLNHRLFPSHIFHNTKGDILFSKVIEILTKKLRKSEVDFELMGFIGFIIFRDILPNTISLNRTGIKFPSS